MFPDIKTIIATYERIEEDNGGLANASPRYILELTANELDMEIEKVRSVMIDHWTMNGGG